MVDVDVKKLLVKELREELTKRGLDAKGKKDELVARLQEALDADSKPEPAPEPVKEAPAPTPPKASPAKAPAKPKQSSAKPAAAPKAADPSPAKKKRAAKAPEPEPEAAPMETDQPASETAEGAAEEQGKGDTQKGGKKKKPKKDRESSHFYISLKDIQEDNITKMADANWSGHKGGKQKKFSPDLVKEIYTTELVVDTGKPLKLQRVMLLEYSQYLEKYLWPNFDPESATFEHVASILIMVNEKFREGVPAWGCFEKEADKFGPFMARVMTLKDGREELGIQEKIIYLLFMIHAFQSLESEMVRGQMLRLVSLPLWHALSPGRRQLELRANPQLDKHWRHLAKKEAKAKVKNPVPPEARPEARFVVSLVEEYLAVLDGVAAGEAEKPDPQELLYCERFMEFLIDLLSQLPTRRFVRALLDDRAVLVKCRMAPLGRHPGGRLFGQLVDLFRFYQGFEINDHTGVALTDDDMVAAHSERICQLQRLCFRHVPKLRELALSHVAAIEKRPVLTKYLASLSGDELRTLATRQLRLVHDEDAWVERPEFLKEVLVSSFEKRRSQRQTLNSLPLYPNEDVLWDENMVPSINYTGEGCLALPKLNLQFLTSHDYLLRNFNLFRLEATYEIREDIHDCLQRVRAFASEEDDGDTRFGGWARMGVPVGRCKVVNVAAPNVGETKPSDVLAEVTYDLGRNARQDVRREWDELKQHDVVFLLTVRPPDPGSVPEGAGVREKFGLAYVRGAEVVEARDEKGDLMNDMTGRVKPDQWKPPQGSGRNLLLALDTAQYQLDTDNMVERGGEDVYGTFNLLMRRRPKENNFKAILECIRDLMNEATVMPEWLHDIFLGYGDPAAAHYSNMPDTLSEIDFKDTFLDNSHLEASFPDHKVTYVDEDGNAFEGESPSPPFRVTFPAKGEGEEKKKGKAAAPTLVAEPYVPPDPGPYPENQPPRNSVRFTPVQVEAIKAGVQPGLSMVVGPPGTGKTDVAVQILHCLYHNCPGQRTLLITHSNQALNDLFQKFMERDVPARYLLRLGQGEQELETALDFSRAGRVNAMLARRLELLAEVERMAKGLGVAADMAYTCETAAHFWLLHVLSRWEKFLADVDAKPGPSAVKGKFPFKGYFEDVFEEIFEGRSMAADMARARGCFRHLRTMFTELEECRAFELLKNQGDRSNYLLTKHAKIVAMTCTHAALKRHDFLKLGFKYDNLLMEESAQILEIETFIPMLLQKQEDGHSRLKRCILIGDHHQLPPVVKNMAFQKYSHLDQSLFTRFVRLGTPYIELNAQGRARPEIAQLYNWRYRALGDLPSVAAPGPFTKGNAGFLHSFQFVDVGDYNGRGESEPTPHFMQNLGEAEYIVSVFQYMRLLGYPAEKISILTTYNGQKHLLRDVINQRCAGHPMFGRPRKVTTVDKYQGQQNDYVLLSLVRTRVAGHVRDVRRLVVAMSRARLGLYVFGRRSLFENCYELAPTFAHLLARPTQLMLVPKERHPAERAADAEVPGAVAVEGLQQMGVVVGEIATAWMQQQFQEKQAEFAAQQQQAAAAAAAAGGGEEGAAAGAEGAEGAAAGGGGGEEGDAAPMEEEG